MQDQKPYVVIRQAIQTADIDYPDIEPGVTRDRITRSNEESEHLAQAVLKALERNGLRIVDAPDA